MSTHPNHVEVGPAGGRLPVGQLLQATATATGVRAIFSDQEVTFVADWLRDNCQCPKCRIVQTDERRYQPWVNPNNDIASLSVADGTLNITWGDGHESEFTDATWRRFDTATHRGAYEANLWRGDYTLQRFVHAQAVSDVATQRQLFEAFLQDGAIIITDSPTVPGTVMDTVRSLGITLHDSSLGLIFDVKLDPKGYNVAFTSEFLPPHNDNAQYTDPPSGQVLAMLVNEADGGESLVVDGWSVLEQLQAVDPAAIEVLSRVAVGHRQYSVEADAFSRNPQVKRHADGHFSHLRFSNQLRQPLPFDHPDLAEWYRAYRALGNLVSDPANQVSFRLNAGDMLFVNGMRVLHARAEYQPNGPRHLQDVYFDVDDVVGNLARLTGAAANAMAT